MRVAEEIDAVEAMAVHSVSYLVSTRLIAGLIAIVPLYSLAVLASFFAARFTTVFINGQSAGLYDHYFNTFLIPTDLLWSFLQAIVMSIAVMLIHTYYGYNASGGPVGVGMAVGQAVRTSLIVVVVITLFISLAVYGASGNFNLSGKGDSQAPVHNAVTSGWQRRCWPLCWWRLWCLPTSLTPQPFPRPTPSL